MGILNRKISFRLFAVGLILVLAVIFTAVCVPVFRRISAKQAVPPCVKPFCAAPWSATP